MLREDTQGLRVTGEFADGPPAVESTEVGNLSPKIQQRRRVLIQSMTPKKLWFVSNAVIRVALLLDP